MKEHLRKNRRDFYEFLDDNSIAIIYSGNEVHKSADAVHDFFINNNFYYLTGIDQSNPGIAMATPEDNSLYAAENYGADGVYREDVTVTYEDGSTEVVTNTSEGASFATGSGAPSAVGTSGVAQTTVVQSGTNSEGVARNF